MINLILSIDYNYLYMKKILIIEDEVEISTHMAKFLTAAKYNCHFCYSGKGAVELVKSMSPDLIFLDIMLPEVDGIEICRQIRSFSDVAIIMITAKTEEVDRIHGLEVGADDYLCKPFSLPEMVLRANSLLRRAKTFNDESFKVNKQTFEITYQHAQIQLTSLEFSLFYLLYKAPERIYSRNQIMDLAYPDLRDISDRAIDSHVKKIRKKFKIHQIEENIIESVYGAGYRFVCP